MTTLAGMKVRNIVGPLVLEHMPLVDLAGLYLLTTVGSLTLSNLPHLIDVDGLAGLVLLPPLALTSMCCPSYSFFNNPHSIFTIAEFQPCNDCFSLVSTTPSLLPI